MGIKNRLKQVYEFLIPPPDAVFIVNKDDKEAKNIKLREEELAFYAYNVKKNFMHIDKTDYDVIESAKKQFIIDCNVKVPGTAYSYAISNEDGGYKLCEIEFLTLGTFQLEFSVHNKQKTYKFIIR